MFGILLNEFAIKMVMLNFIISLCPQAHNCILLWGVYIEVYLKYYKRLILAFPGVTINLLLLYCWISIVQSTPVDNQQNCKEGGIDLHPKKNLENWSGHSVLDPNFMWFSVSLAPFLLCFIWQNIPSSSTSVVCLTSQSPIRLNMWNSLKTGFQTFNFVCWLYYRHIFEIWKAFDTEHVCALLHFTFSEGILPIFLEDDHLVT